MDKTCEGANKYSHSMNHALEFFSKAGSLYANRGSFYGNETSAKELFINSFIVDKVLSMKLLFWLRDCRGGAGNRSGAREIIEWLGNDYPDWMGANMHLIPTYGRWDDLKALFKTPLRNAVGIMWADAISNGDVLAAKWAKRHYTPIRHALGMKESEFRKLLSGIRKEHIVEHKMCQGQWDKIEYKTVPSVAMARYTKAFAKNDEKRFEEFKTVVKSGVEKVHAGVLFPHDCIRTALHGDGEMAELQFDALPNFMEDSGENVMVVCDTSGSMQQVISGSVQAIHVSMGMALYCSSRVPVDSPFYKRFVGFCDEGRLVDWRNHTFSSALNDRRVFNYAIGSTRIDRAFDTILKIAIERNVPQDLMPSTLLIVSDMQFHNGGVARNSETEVERSLRAWDAEGYDRPKVVYWNTAGYAGSQSTAEKNNVGMVSGFSPSICKAIFGGEDFSPMSIMFDAIEKYEIVDPMNSM